MFQNIVVGTDGSERAARAVAQAAHLAVASDATLHVIHAYRGTRGSIREAGEAVVAQVVDDLSPTGVRLETYALQGDPADVMIEWTRKNAAELLIVGNRGMTGAKRVLGSIPNTLAHRADSAVLIVPTDDPDPRHS